MKKTAIFLLLFVFPVASNAVCAQADLTGTWAAYVVGASGSGSSVFFWDRCVLRILGSGSLDTAASVCRSNLGSVGKASSGKFVVTAACVVTGTIIAPGNTIKVTEATMSRDKETWTGVGISSASAYQFTAVRK